jgi:hypothetical protein
MDLDMLDVDDCDTLLQKTFDKGAAPPMVHNGTFSAAATASNTAIHNGTFSAGRSESAAAVTNETFSAGGRPSHPAGDVTFAKNDSGNSDALLNATYAKPEGGECIIFSSDQQPAALNATFDAKRAWGDDENGAVRRSPQQPAGLNSTFSRSNSGGGRVSNGQRKMSEDRLSSASSG